MREVHHHGIQGERSGCGQHRAQEATQVSKGIAAREGGTREEDGHTAKPGSLRCRGRSSWQLGSPRVIGCGS